MSKRSKFDPFFVFSIGFLIAISLVSLKSVYPSIFPGYFFLTFLCIGFFIIFSYIDFDVISLFSKHFYVGSIILLLLTLIIGGVTRGVVRWISLGTLTLQAAEITKPFLLVFFANYLYKERLNSKGIIKTIALMGIPVALIFIQPSLGVSFLLTLGFIGVLLASEIKKINFVYLVVAALVLIPVVFSFLAPYQKSRITSFLNPYSDPKGSGYNSIQSQIAVGDGKLFGRGLGKGVQTQLSFLPEKQTDFIFAAISEELGFVGAVLTLISFFILFWRITAFMGNAVNPQARAYLAGIFTMLLFQTVIHIGMNMGLLPITGVPLPLVSAGGSSFVSTMIALGIALGARRR
ncbi:MAG: FtsW/RodA/SpoVE family cell cycle protein [Candidatus Woesebacteria bacterium]|nr:FtsW/RodA/SpoVE family cell cycle protein [Candidatus Woesebacteria bacterium]